jgi:hypothetical protein
MTTFASRRDTEVCHLEYFVELSMNSCERSSSCVGKNKKEKKDFSLRSMT